MQRYAFVDLETTGGSPTSDRIIEIGVVLTEGQTIIKEYSTLIDPDRYLPPEISEFTGISQSELDRAPTFRSVSEHLLELLSDSIFVAHNARFDYAFLKSEFKRVGITFSSKQLCTVKLSRRLFPHLSHHNLDALIDHLDLDCDHRHRALPDAKVVYQLLSRLQSLFNESELSSHITSLTRNSSEPQEQNVGLTKHLPHAPGVYLMYDSNGGLLYIGKAKDIKVRCKSHFVSDYLSAKELELSRLVSSIDYQVTSGEFGALLLESQLIKKHSPLLNRRLRKKGASWQITKNTSPLGYYQASIVPFDPLLTDSLGVFGTRAKAKQFLQIQTSTHLLCPKLNSLESGNSSCFAYSIGKCLGACAKVCHVDLYNAKFIEAFSSTKIPPWPFSGRIVFREFSELSQIGSAFMFDNWCYLGDLQKDEIFTTPHFDHDIFNLLNKYLSKPNSQHQITVL